MSGLFKLEQYILGTYMMLLFLYSNDIYRLNLDQGRFLNSLSSDMRFVSSFLVV